MRKKPVSSFITPQDSFWAGEFGTDYIRRNRGDELLACNLEFFVSSLSRAYGIQSCIEFGANIGMNIMALKLLYPKIEAHGIEINSDAVKELRGVIRPENAYKTSILEFCPVRQWDLVLIKTVLIHIHPDNLDIVYEKLVKCTSRFLLVAEYYSQVPIEVIYRGHSGKLFKRDFAGEILDAFPEMRLIDYGFRYRRDPKFPQDDISWFLMEKMNHV